MTMTYWKAEYRDGENAIFHGELYWDKTAPSAVQGCLWQRLPSLTDDRIRERRVVWSDARCANKDPLTHTTSETAAALLELLRALKQAARRRGLVTMAEDWTELGKNYAEEMEAA